MNLYQSLVLEHVLQHVQTDNPYSYGFENPSKIQNKAIPILVTGKDIIAQAQSGTGKTATFTIGLLQLLDESVKETQVIILSHTRELAIQINDVVKIMGPNESAYIPVGAKHRLSNPSSEPLKLIEVQSGEYLGEDDIVRLEDVYRR